MNAADILKYGDRNVRSGIADLPEAWWDVPGACGTWSIKDILAHLASFELALVEVLGGFTGATGPTPLLDAYNSPDFNDAQVAARTGHTPQAVVAEYDAAHAEVMARLARIPAETLRQPGTLPWYGAEYALDDFLVYAYYGHKREHTAQIAAMRDRLKG
ncbi:MAG TPA: DinB family protein [Ktedonobacterales bacterium]|nr:DinB family protein [Ktedonobacterales bacterium]